MTSLNFAEAQETSAESHKVIVEPTFVQTSKIEETYQLVPYLERRPRWGNTVSIGYSSYNPVYLESNFVAAGISEPYETPEVPLIELQYVLKRNFSFGSPGFELALGYYSNDSDDDRIESTLNFKMGRVGVNYSMDTLSPEPFIVPYVAAGIFAVMYEESLGGNSHNGNTQPAPYFTLGAMLQLDWIDRHNARVAYEDSGMQSSYVYAEGRKMFASMNEDDPDYESDVHWNAGVRVEF